MSDYNKETGAFIGEHTYKFDNTLAVEIDKGFSFDTMIDLGCGIGRYCKYFNHNGGLVTGVEGSEDAYKNRIYDNILHRDLTQPINIPIHDVTLCLEVGEHIPKQHQDVFIDNVISVTGKKIVLSWAIPGQKGKGHVNCKSNDEVIDIMTSKGLQYKDRPTKIFRGASSLSWFKNTILVFSL